MKCLGTWSSVICPQIVADNTQQSILEILKDLSCIFFSDNIEILSETYLLADTLVSKMPNRGCRVYIGNMPSGVRERDLEKFFKSYGKPYDFLIKQGYGFVEFDDYRDADDAVYDLNGKVSKPIYRVSSMNLIINL